MRARTPVMGELVDMNSTDTGFFCGILDATVTVHGDATQMDMTNPNGRIEGLTIHEARAQLDIAPPHGHVAVLAAGEHVHDARDHDRRRAGRGERRGDQRADVHGRERARLRLRLDARRRCSSTSTARRGRSRSRRCTRRRRRSTAAAWAPGDTGANVFFPNVDPASGTTLVSMSGGLGAGSVPLAAGTFTFLTVVGR